MKKKRSSMIKVGDFEGREKERGQLKAEYWGN